MQLIKVLNIFFYPNCTALVRRTRGKSSALVVSSFSLERPVELVSVWKVESVPVDIREM